MPLFRRTTESRPKQPSPHSNPSSGTHESPKMQPSVQMNQDDSDFSLYQSISNTSASDLPHSLQARNRTSSVGQKFKSFFTPHASSTSLAQDGYAAEASQASQASQTNLAAAQRAAAVAGATPSDTTQRTNQHVTSVPSAPPDHSLSSPNTLASQSQQLTSRTQTARGAPRKPVKPLAAPAPGAGASGTVPSRGPSKSPASLPTSPPLSANSSLNSPNLASQSDKLTISNVELAESLSKLKMMPSVIENDLDDVLERSDEHSSDSDREQARINIPSVFQQPASSSTSSSPGLAPSTTVGHPGGASSGAGGTIPQSASLTSSASSMVSQPLAQQRGRSGKLRSKFMVGSGHGNPSEESLSPPLSRSNSLGSRKRASSISMANTDSYQHNNGFYNAIKHTQSANYSSTHLYNQKEHLLKLKNGRLKISTDGSSHEHDYYRYKTQPLKNKSWFVWGKKKDAEDDSYVTTEKSVSLLPDSYSEQLMELKSDPKNYRWNYDDSDDGTDSEEDVDSEDDEDVDDDFDDEADDQLIEPIIGKDQLNLINMMMDKIEHPNKYKDKLMATAGKRLTLSQKYGHIEGVVGRGSYGTVCISVRSDTENKKRKFLYAVKQLKQRPGETLHHFGNRVTSEFMISSSLTHQAVINVYDLMVDPVTMTYSQVMEFIPCGDLFSLIAVTNGLEVVECDCFFKQILNAITYLHSVGISHNDLKVENLLLTRKGQLKIIDFGTSAVFKTAWEDKVQYSKGACGSERYVSPEQFNGDREYDPRLADIWSLGIIYLVMLYGNYAWEVAKTSDESYEHFLSTRSLYDYTQRSKSAYRQYKLVKKGTFNQIESISKGPCPNSRRYVLYNILNPDPKYRMRSYQIWQSDWIKSIRVCDAGRGFLSHEDYIDMAYKTLQQQQQLQQQQNGPTPSPSGGNGMPSMFARDESH